MSDISSAIDGFYELLRERGIKTSDTGKILDKDFPDYDPALRGYVCEHIADAAPYAKRQGRFGVQVPFDRTRFTDRLGEKFCIYFGNTAITHGIQVLLLDEVGRNYPVSRHIEDSNIEAVSVLADTKMFIQDYRARMTGFQEIVGILTGKVDGFISYKIWNPKDSVMRRAQPESWEETQARRYHNIVQLLSEFNRSHSTG